MKQNITIKTILLGIVVFICITLSSCKKYVKVNLPDSQITGTVVYQDIATANAALANIYISIREKGIIGSMPFGLISPALGLYADELTYIDSYAGIEQQFFKNNLLIDDPMVLDTWNNSYNLIYATNVLIEGLDQSSKISEADKNRLKGEALFIRAYIHFYLVNLYGSVPYITSSDYRINSTVGKIAPREVYAAIIADLKQAKVFLPEAYPTIERARINRSVASAMLARIYLYSENWTAAEIEAGTVIANSLYTWVGNLEDVFLKGSTGTLWQIALIGGSPSAEGQYFNSNNSKTTLSDKLLAAFEIGDQRKIKWIGNVTVGTETFYFPNKYKQYLPLATSTEYLILFRVDEQYLIRAEARAKLGDISGAQADLNKIRNRAGLGDTPANDESTLSEAILKERRVELFAEQGHRFLDLKRTNKANATLAYKDGWDIKDILWPLPENELLLNPNLKPQNPGYQ